VFTPGGQRLSIFGDQSVFIDPMGMAVAPDGTAYVVGSVSNKVVRFITEIEVGEARAGSREG